MELLVEGLQHGFHHNGTRGARLVLTLRKLPPDETEVMTDEMFDDDECPHSQEEELDRSWMGVGCFKGMVCRDRTEPPYLGRL
jgi:hypothetical protein